MPLTLAAGSLLGGLGGSLLSGIFGRSSAKKSMAFQREMAKNAHQYEVEDLRKAGLNPILSGTGGPGARASGGAMPQTPDFGGTAIASMMAKANIKNIEAQTNLTNKKAGILTTGGTLGEDINSVYQYIKSKFPKSAQDVNRLYNDYMSLIGKGNSSGKKPLTITIPQSGKFNK